MNKCVQTTGMAHRRVWSALVLGSLCVGGVSAYGLFLALPSPHLSPRVSVPPLCLLASPYYRTAPDRSGRKCHFLSLKVTYGLARVESCDLEHVLKRGGFTASFLGNGHRVVTHP